MGIRQKLGFGFVAGAALGVGVAAVVAQRRNTRKLLVGEAQHTPHQPPPGFIPAWPLSNWLPKVEFPASSQQMTVRRPDNNEVLADVPIYSREQVQAVVARARAAQPAWAALTVQQRAAPFIRLHDMLPGHYSEITDLLQAEGGKTRRDAIGEVVDILNTIRYYSSHGPGWLRPQRRRPGLPISSSARVIYKPYGVVGFIAPWNFPMVLAVSDAIPALLAGNTVVVKVAEQTPFCGLWAVEQLKALGLPDGVYQVVTGDGSTTGSALVDEVDYISFTGSLKIGQIISKRAGERMIPATLELGGKNPAIVLPDVDLNEATDRLIEAKFGWNGQLCVGIERCYVPESIFDAFSAMLKYKIATLNMGVASDFSTQVGTLMFQPQVDKFLAHLADAKAKGAEVLVGGEARPEIGPHFVEPTVLINVPPNADVYREETFAPLMSLYPYQSIDDAIAMANDSDYGLQATVLTGNPGGPLAQYVAERIDAGNVAINEMVLSWQTSDVPMGGMKRSGLGRRHAKEGLIKFVQSQSIVTLHYPSAQHMGGGALRFNERIVKALMAFLRVWRYIPFIR